MFLMFIELAHCSHFSDCARYSFPFVVLVDRFACYICLQYLAISYYGCASF